MEDASCNNFTDEDQSEKMNNKRETIDLAKAEKENAQNARGHEMTTVKLEAPSQSAEVNAPSRAAK